MITTKVSDEKTGDGRRSNVRESSWRSDFENVAAASDVSLPLLLRADEVIQ